MNQEAEDSRNLQRETIQVEEANSAPRTNLLTFKTGEIAQRLLSIDHAMFFFSQKCGFYLPPSHVISWHFVSQLLAGEKILLKASDVGAITRLPRAKGVMVEDLWDQYKGVNNLQMFLPDFTPGMRVPREYFFNVDL